MTYIETLVVIDLWRLSVKLSVSKNTRIVVPKEQRGSIAVYMAAGVVALGSLFAIAIQTNAWLGQAKQENFYKELMQVESLVWSYYEKAGRWPGDCDGDGVIAYLPPSSGTGSGIMNDGSDASCVNTSSESFLAALNDLRNLKSDEVEALVDNADVPTFLIGHGQIAGKNSNVIVAYDVPVTVAQWLDQRIDGDTHADNGRVRIWGQDQAQVWPDQSAQKVAVAYYFEPQVPNS